MALGLEATNTPGTAIALGSNCFNKMCRLIICLFMFCQLSGHIVELFFFVA